jgi:hypothetical protein
MMSALLEDVMKLAEQLNSEEQNVLIHRLQERQRELQELSALNRDELMKRIESLRQSPPKAENSLLGKYSNPNLPEISEAEFHTQLHEIANEWEQE